MMHVAEASEARGRVVLHLCSTAPNQVAIEAAVWIAQAFHSEIEGLYVEDLQLLDLAAHPFVREISFTGRTRRALSIAEITRHFRFASADFHRRIQQLALAVDVPVRQSIMRGDPLNAIAKACADNGPWNVVVLAEPFPGPHCPSIKMVFDKVSGTTGLLIVGRFVKRTTGSIVLALEHPDLLPAMLATADRLAAANSAPIIICLVAENSDAVVEMEASVRLALAERAAPPLTALDMSRSSPPATTEALRRLRPGLVVGQFGGLLVPDESDLKPMAEGLECPFLIVR